MKYQTTIHDEGIDFKDILKERIATGWAIYSLWPNPTKVSYPRGGDFIVTWIKVMDRNE